MSRPEIEYVDLPEGLHYHSEYGSAVKFKRTILNGKYRLTDTEIADLLAEKEITVMVDFGSGPRKVTGKLAGNVFTPEDSDRGPIPFVAFTRTDRVRGIFGPTGEEVAFGAVWGPNEHWDGHKWTPEEIKSLLVGETVGFEAVSRKGKKYEANGKLGQGQYGFGFQLMFDN